MYDVVISGGGPVGLGLAVELGQRGVRVAVIEPNHSPPVIPKGQNLTQRTMEHMQAWGVEDAIRSAKTIPKGYGLGGLTAYGSLLSGYHYDWFKRGDVDAFYNASNERLPQYATEAVLRRRVGELDTVNAHIGWKTVGIEADEAGVTVSASLGDETMRIRASYLVGCDGSRSFARQSAGISETLDDHGRTMALVVFQSPEFFRLLERFPNKQFYNVLRPENDGYWMFFGMVEWGKSFFFHAPVPSDTDREQFDFKRHIERAIGTRVEMELTYVGFWDLRISLADTYRIGRVFIAGDAAHSHPPYGGYGINTGFEDARNLGWKLAATLQGWGGPALLDSYDAERRPVFASTARNFIGQFIREDREFVRSFNPELDKRAFEDAWSARAAGAALHGIGDFAPHYSGSPVICSGGTETPSAIGRHEFSAIPGHHLPPFPSKFGSSVTNLLGQRMSIVAQSSVRIEEHRRPQSAQWIEVENAGNLPALTLVRPDGYVAGTAETPEELAGLHEIGCGWKKNRV